MYIYVQICFATAARNVVRGNAPVVRNAVAKWRGDCSTSCISNSFLRDTSMQRSSVVGDTHVETDLLSGHHLWIPDVTDHSCSLATVAVHPRWGGEGAIQEAPFSSFTSVHPSYAAWDGPKFAASGVPQDSTFVTKLPANHSCFLLAPIIVADGLTFLENIPLCLDATSNKASPVLTNSFAQFCRESPC